MSDGDEVEILVYDGAVDDIKDWVQSGSQIGTRASPFIWFQHQGGIPWEPQSASWLLRRPVFVDPEVDWFTTPLFDGRGEPIDNENDAISAAREWLRDHPH